MTSNTPSQGGSFTGNQTPSASPGSSDKYGQAQSPSILSGSGGKSILSGSGGQSEVRDRSGRASHRTSNASAPTADQHPIPMQKELSLVATADNPLLLRRYISFGVGTLGCILAVSSVAGLTWMTQTNHGQFNLVGTLSSVTCVDGPTKCEINIDNVMPDGPLTLGVLNMIFAVVAVFINALLSWGTINTHDTFRNMKFTVVALYATAAVTGFSSVITYSIVFKELHGRAPIPKGATNSEEYLKMASGTAEVDVGGGLVIMTLASIMLLFASGLILIAVRRSFAQDAFYRLGFDNAKLGQPNTDGNTQPAQSHPGTSIKPE